MSDQSKPPAMPEPPWTRGRHGTHDVAILTVQICKDEFGRVYSAHTVATPEDQEIMMSWPSGGMEQSSHALLMEAARREALFEMILQMSNDKEYLARVNAMSEEDRDVALAEMAGKLETQMTKTVKHLSKTVVKQAFALVNG